MTKLIIKFENPAHGQLQREANPDKSVKYPGGTVIEKVSFAFSLSKKKGSIATARVYQFPVKLAFAATAHKIQGQTVKKPRKVIVDLRSVFQPAMAYVMLSRVESIDQLYILEVFDESKIYARHQAIKELEKMNQKSVNQKPSHWHNLQAPRTRVSVLNCGSLRPQFEHLRLDETLRLSDAICLTETWIWSDEDTARFELEGYMVHHNSVGRGKGIAGKGTHRKRCKSPKPPEIFDSLQPTNLCLRGLQHVLHRQQKQQLNYIPPSEQFQTTS